MKQTILVVDDDPLVNEFVTETLTRSHHQVTSVHSGEEAILAIKQQSFDIVFTDFRMKEIDGIGVLDHTRRLSPDTIVILMTAYGTVETAVKAVKRGAWDFLLKPVLPETLELMIERIADLRQLREENHRLKKEVEHRFHNIVGKSKIMELLFDHIASIADTRSTVLLTGASGTGKEMVARAIHYASPRKNGPFVKLNCAALPETLVEAELFGYEKGAFTDAKRTNRGRFELADGGTLLLDEISEMPINLQSKLLRVIQEREFERVGSSQTIAVDVRIVATSNRDLKEYVAAGKFREDLYYRLNVIPIPLPPLKDRKEDIPLLVEHFIAKYNRENNRSVAGIEPSALQMLVRYNWPGNVRELENTVERAVVTAREAILTSDDFPLELQTGGIRTPENGIQFPISLADSERYLILRALKETNGNKTLAAKLLGITARTIRNKLQEYQLQN